ncbi:MAG: hypothetical protein JOZ41_09840, partial [Chloroflexi bacterium]|nr:hypothetical protein [Chloroflexota bacterium]
EDGEGMRPVGEGGETAPSAPDGLVSRADALRLAGGTVAGLLLGPDAVPLVTRAAAAAPRDTRIVRCAMCRSSRTLAPTP